ncbi:MAG: relaxase/mobilization nuclease domain-containing protein, partial [Faecousia sp.]
MAVTSIWRVNGWLGKVVIYVENPGKTENPAFYEKQDMTDRQAQGLSDVIDYAVNSEKTQTADEATEVMQQFVSGINCHPSTAREEMIAVKKRFGKEDGTIAYHGYQSFAPGEATPEMAHEIGVKLAQQLWGDKYQVVVATHLDKANHLHNHFVLNTVSFVDGIKYYRSAKDYHDLQVASDALCREYGLSVIENPRPGKGKHYGEWRAEQEQRPTWRGIVRSDIDEIIRQSMTERQFFDNLRKRGYEVKMGKDISVRPPGKERFVRLERNYGEDYSLEGIRRRILMQQRPERPMPEPERKVRRAKLRGDFKNTRKVTGFRALYFHYCYLLGIFPRSKPKSNKRLHFLLREDLAKLDAISEETKLLVRNHIDTAEQLSSYKEGLETKIKLLAADRKALYRKQRTVSVKTDDDTLARVKEQITAISRELSALRKEVRLCEDIAIRSGVIKEKIRAVREDEQSQGKENKRDEQF